MDLDSTSTNEQRTTQRIDAELEQHRELQEHFECLGW